MSKFGRTLGFYLILLGCSISAQAANNKTLEDAAAAFAKEYVAHFLNGDIFFMKENIVPEIHYQLEHLGSSADGYLQLREKLLFSENTWIRQVRLGRATTFKLKGDFVVFIPRQFDLDNGIGISKSNGLYILISKDNGRTWKVYDNQCSHQEFVAKFYPESEVDLREVMKSKADAEVIVNPRKSPW